MNKCHHYTRFIYFYQILTDFCQAKDYIRGLYNACGYIRKIKYTNYVRTGKKKGYCTSYNFAVSILFSFSHEIQYTIYKKFKLSILTSYIFAYNKQV